MASAKKKSNSRNPSSQSRRVVSVPPRKPSVPAAHFAVCVKNDGYPASLELRKLYPLLEDEFAEEHGMVRVIDESGEDYLYPSTFFVRVELPQAIEQVLQKIA